MIRSNSRADVLIPLLACLVEGAAIAVIDALFAAGARRTALGPLAFGLAAAAGLLWVRRAAPDAERPGLVAIIAIAFVGGAWLARDVAAIESNFPFSLLSEPAGWLAAIAVVRGTAHRDPEEEDLVVAGLLRWGIPLLTIPWLLGVALPVGTHAEFIRVAFPATVLFAGGGLLALGLSRLEALAFAAGVDWRRNRAWLLLMFGVVLLVMAVAVPAALLLGEPVGQVLGGLVGPFAALFTPIAGFVALLLAPLVGLVSGFFDLLQQLFGITGQPSGPLGPSGIPDPPVVEPGEPGGIGSAVVTVLTVAAIVIGLIVLARIARRAARPAQAVPVPGEEHEFVPPSFALHLPRLRRPERPGRPATATAAYLAFLADAERRDELARRPEEGPETHARRLRTTAATAGDALTAADLRAASLLAADYELERYGLRDLPPRETRRALSRWQRLRGALRSGRLQSPGPAGAAGPSRPSSPPGRQPPRSPPPLDRRAR